MLTVQPLRSMTLNRFKSNALSLPHFHSLCNPPFSCYGHVADHEGWSWRLWVKTLAKLVTGLLSRKAVTKYNSLVWDGWETTLKLEPPEGYTEKLTD